ncbi:MAG: hypothetical protein JNK89_06545, partial [Saprospiraceae bacterium]|nr:hypothetical protein [Saprospiraceae bacterium]
MPRYPLYSAFFTLLLGTFACQNAPEHAGDTASGKAVLEAYYGTPVLDGSAADDIWEASDWQLIDQVWIGNPPSADDFSGRYKIAWDENNLYLLAEITDDSLLDIHPDALEYYWDDDCLEIFLDEDASGGNHQYNYNAFAYHISLDGRVVDIAPDSTFRFFDDHCISRRITRDKISTWEVAIRIFDGAKLDPSGENIPKLLKAGKKMGFAVAYCDNDRS